MIGASDPRAMPLDEFIAEVMDILKTQANAPVLGLYGAAAGGNYAAVFNGLNVSMEGENL